MSKLPHRVLDQLSKVVAKAENPDLSQTPEAAVARRLSARKPKTREESFRDLDGYEDEARAGMPDEVLARVTNTSVTAVMAWRTAKGIKRRPGPNSRESEVWAVDVFGNGYVSPLVEIRPPTKGSWDVPAYVLRQPLHYDRLCQFIHFLHTRQGATTENLAEALGFKERDIEMAIAVEELHLRQHGTPCPACSRPMDPAYGRYCSKTCEDT